MTPQENKPFENTGGKGEITRNEQFLLYPQYFPAIFIKFNPLPDDKILDSSKLKQCADDNFEFDENTRKLSQREENTVGKGEIARYEQFLLFPLCFHKACFPGASKGVNVWEWVKIVICRLFHFERVKYLSFEKGLTLPLPNKQIMVFHWLKNKMKKEFSYNLE